MTEHMPPAPRQFTPYTDFVEELAVYQQGGEVLRVGSLNMQSLSEHHAGVRVMAEQIQRTRGKDTLDWLPYGYRSDEERKHLEALHKLHYPGSIPQEACQGAEFIAKTLVAAAGTHLVVTDSELLCERSVQAHLHLREERGVLKVTELLTDDLSYAKGYENAAAAALYLAMEGINKGTETLTVACPPAYATEENRESPLFAAFTGRAPRRGSMRLVGAIPQVREQLEQQYGLTPSFLERRRKRHQQKP
ncbi:MAG TPA: hypothetical protein VFI74_01840 [Candidatus Saccharimonadales bacterium]|nr:hypothetical protein [Candidatus Saccharimonadales bacterium]